MVTLKEWNESNLRSIEEAKKTRHLTGVACDSCGDELHYAGPRQGATRPVWCPHCDATGSMIGA